MSRGPRPLIGVSSPDRGGFPAWLFASWAIRMAGGRAVRIRPSRPHADKRLDGLIIGGGADIAPKLYGEEPIVKPEASELSRRLGWLRAILSFLLAPIVYVIRRLFSRKWAEGLDHARDDLEFGLLDRAMKEKIPVLGICRGAQLINVHAGGTLHRDLQDFYVERQNPWTVLPRKRIQIEGVSTLSDALGSQRCWVNSLHRQAVDKLGDRIRITARDDSGVVQAIEHEHHEFCIGVQWHPEYLPQQQEQRRLFRRFVTTARQVRGMPSRPRGPRREQVAGDSAT